MTERRTPKQRVVDCHPRAYVVRYGRVACIYREPAVAVPRGRVAEVVVIGAGASVRAAWRDAAERLSPRAKKEPQP